MKKTLAATSALVFAIALASMPQAQAASLLNAGTTLRVDGFSQIVQVRMHRHSGRHFGSKHPGGCGENMYYSRKAHHCLDARDKA